MRLQPQLGLVGFDDAFKQKQQKNSKNSGQLGSIGMRTHKLNNSSGTWTGSLDLRLTA